MTENADLPTVLDVVTTLIDRGADVHATAEKTERRRKLNYVITFPNKWELSLTVERWLHDLGDDMTVQKYAEWAAFKPDGSWYLPENTDPSHGTYVEHNVPTDRILQVAEYISAL